MAIERRGVDTRSEEGRPNNITNKTGLRDETVKNPRRQTLQPGNKVQLKTLGPKPKTLGLWPNYDLTLPGVFRRHTTRLKEIKPSNTA
jgi:hypothetical protein